MSKKVFIILSIVVLVAAAIACTVFLITTADLEPESRALSFDGCWRVFADGKADQGVEHFVFTDTQVKDYRDGTAKPYFESEYTVAGNVITIKQLGQDFSVEQKTDSIRLLYNQNSTYLIVKVADDAYTNTKTFTAADLAGDYTVALHGNNVAGNETISFTNDRFVCNRDGAVYLDTTFAVDNNVLTVGPMRFYVCYADGNELRFVEIADGASYLGWSLVKDSK